MGDIKKVTRHAILILAISMLIFTGCDTPIDKSENDDRQAPIDKVYSVPPAGKYAVIHIVDGDTLDIGVPLKSGGLLKQRIRLRGIDTPERGEKGYQEATDELKRLAGEWVVISYSSGQRKRGHYGRLLCYLKSAKSEDVSLDLLKGKFARLYRKTGHNREDKYWSAATKAQWPKKRSSSTQRKAYK